MLEPSHSAAYYGAITSHFIFQNKVLFGNIHKPEMTSSNDSVGHRSSLIDSVKKKGEKNFTQIHSLDKAV